MKKHQTKKEFTQHLHNYLAIAMLAFIGMLTFSSLSVIAEFKKALLGFDIPVSVYYLGMFISSMMIIMGLYYFKNLKKFEQQQ